MTVHLMSSTPFLVLIIDAANIHRPIDPFIMIALFSAMLALVVFITVLNLFPSVHKKLCLSEFESKPLS